VTDDEWAQLLKQARGDVTEIQYPRAITFLKSWPTFSKPVCVRCDDGSEYVLKGTNVDGKAIVTEQVVGRLAQLLGAPVPRVTLVDVPSELIAIEPQMKHLEPGLAHASTMVQQCSERMAFEYAKESVNRERFASLAILYGWAQAGDHQLIYDNATKAVWSVDHGHFFPGGPKWSEATLSVAYAAHPDDHLMQTAGLAIGDLQPCATKLSTLTHMDIARAVSSVPETWPVTEAEKIAIARFLDERRSALVKQLGGTP
jgi:hypothetical protein